MKNQIFKGKRTDDGNWLYWNEYGELTNMAGNKKTYKRKMKNGTVVCHYIHQLQHFLDKATVSMCSGAADLEGLLIFENDILQWHDDETGADRYSLVGYKNGCFVINAERDDSEILPEILCLGVEVAGNIFENPELV